MTTSAAERSRAWRLGEWIARALGGIRFRIGLGVLIAAVLPSLLVVPAQLQRVQTNLRAHAEAMLLQVARVQQRRVNDELTQIRDHSNLIASRTQMRLQLAEFNRQQTEEARDFITRVLADALVSARSTDSLWVYDLDYQPVTGAGNMAQRLQDPLRERPDFQRELFQAQSFWPRQDVECKSAIWVSTPLLLEGEVIGALLAKFRLDGIRELLADFPHPELIGTSFVLMPESANPDDCSAIAEQLHWSLAPAEYLRDREVVQFFRRLPSEQLLRRETEDGQYLVIALPLDFGMGRLYTQSSMTLSEKLREQILAGTGLSIALILVLALAFSVWTARRLASPVRVLSNSVKQIRDGGAWQPIDSSGWPRELVSLAAAVDRSALEIADRTAALRGEISRRQEAQTQLHELANTDELTGLANRRHFFDHLKALLGDIQSDSPAVFLFYIDLDRFKPVNDLHGHAVGDEVLKTVADRLRHLVREGDLAARLGGDEFAVLIQFREALGDENAIADRLESAISQPMKIADITIRVGCSVGSIRLKPSMDIRSALRQADRAMYAVKTARKAAAIDRQGDGNSMST